MKTSDLTGAALDWAVHAATVKSISSCEYWLEKYVDKDRRQNCERYSTDWAQGGPIIEREKICVIVSESGNDWNAEYRFRLMRDDTYWSGHTPLVAAMRCYAASKLGDEIEIPEELK